MLLSYGATPHFYDYNEQLFVATLESKKSFYKKNLKNIDLILAHEQTCPPQETEPEEEEINDEYKPIILVD